MKHTFRPLALALAAVLLCFLVTGCQPTYTGSGWVDLEGNVYEDGDTYRSSTASDGSFTMTRRYTVDSSMALTNGSVLVAQKIKFDSSEYPIQATRLYMVDNRYLENAMPSLSLKDYDDTQTVSYLVFTFNYPDPAVSQVSGVVVEYRDSSDKTIVTATYDRYYALDEITPSDRDTEEVKGALKAILGSDTVSSALRSLAELTWNNAGEMFYS